jgi:tetratricopeptide (TPR) repeat protein
MRSLTPEVLTGLLLAATAALFLCLRPRKRDVFWDVTAAATPGDQAEPKPAAGVPAPELRRAAAAAEATALPPSTRALLELADRQYRAEDYAGALSLYERALGLQSVKAGHYFRASLAALHGGDTARALDVLRQAEADLPAGQMTGVMWYNMGCFAARLGRFPEAMRYLTRAVDAGYAEPEKYRNDPDLRPLHWQPAFKRLLAGIGA